MKLTVGAREGRELAWASKRGGLERTHLLFHHPSDDSRIEVGIAVDEAADACHAAVAVGTARRRDALAAMAST